MFILQALPPDLTVDIIMLCNNGSWFSRWMQLIVLAPYLVSITLFGISFYRAEFFLFLLSISVLIGELIVRGLQYAFKHPVLIPVCNFDAYGMPSSLAFYAGYIVTFWAIYWLFYFQTLHLSSVYLLVIAASVFIAAAWVNYVNTALEIVVGVVIGIILGIVFHLIHFNILIYQYDYCMKSMVGKFMKWGDSFCEKFRMRRLKLNNVRGTIGNLNKYPLTPGNIGKVVET